MNISIPDKIESAFSSESKKQIILGLQAQINSHATEPVDYLNLDGTITSKNRVLAVLSRLYEKAMAGEVRAMEGYLDRIIGRPKQEIEADVTSNGFSLWELAQKASTITINQQSEDTE